MTDAQNSEALREFMQKALDKRKFYNETDENDQQVEVCVLITELEAALAVTKPVTTGGE